LSQTAMNPHFGTSYGAFYCVSLSNQAAYVPQAPSNPTNVAMNFPMCAGAVATGDADLIKECHDANVQGFVDKKRRDIMEEGFKMARERWYDYGTYYEQASYNEPDWCNRFFGKDNCKRLKEIKAKVDPNNVFTCHQCIGDEEVPVTETPTKVPTTASGVKEYTGDIYETALCQKGYKLPDDRDHMGFNPIDGKMTNCYDYNEGCTTTMCFPPWMEYQFRMMITSATGCCEWIGEQWEKPKGCTLTGGESVEDGWSGNDSGTNSCNTCQCNDGALACSRMACECWQKSSDGVDLAPREWNGSGGTDFETCKAKAKSAGVRYFAWTGEVYQPGYCKVLKATIPSPNLNTNQGYGYQLWEDTCQDECWQESGDGVDLAPGEWDGTGGTDFVQCKENAKNAGVKYFAWTGKVYQPGYCKVLKTTTTSPNLGTNQGYGYKLYENTCEEAPPVTEETTCCDDGRCDAPYLTVGFESCAQMWSILGPSLGRCLFPLDHACPYTCGCVAPSDEPSSVQSTAESYGIPQVVTPRTFGSYGYDYWPEPFLAGCEEPIPDGVPDIRGTYWGTNSALAYGEWNGDGLFRFEQCGMRVTMTSAYFGEPNTPLRSMVRDFVMADNSVENGVWDISPGGCFCHPEKTDADCLSMLSGRFDEDGGFFFVAYGVMDAVRFSKDANGNLVRFGYFDGITETIPPATDEQIAGIQFACPGTCMKTYMNYYPRPDGGHDGLSAVTSVYDDQYNALRLEEYIEKDGSLKLRGDMLIMLPAEGFSMDTLTSMNPGTWLPLFDEPGVYTDNGFKVSSGKVETSPMMQAYYNIMFIDRTEAAGWVYEADGETMKVIQPVGDYIFRDGSALVDSTMEYLATWPTFTGEQGKYHEVSRSKYCPAKPKSKGPGKKGRGKGKGKGKGKRKSETEVGGWIGEKQQTQGYEIVGSTSNFVLIFAAIGAASILYYASTSAQKFLSRTNDWQKIHEEEC